VVEAREAAALRKVLPPAQPTPWEDAWLDPLLSAEEEPAAGPRGSAASWPAWWAPPDSGGAARLLNASGMAAAAEAAALTLTQTLTLTLTLTPTLTLTLTRTLTRTRTLTLIRRRRKQ